jgi:hypothetical protein
MKGSQESDVQLTVFPSTIESRVSSRKEMNAPPPTDVPVDRER